MTDAERASIEQIRAELEKDGKPFRELPELNIFKSEPHYTLNADGHVIGLLLNKTPIKELTPLAVFTQLQELHAHNTQISALTPLAALTQLRELNVSGTQISDLTPLAALMYLQRLYVSVTPISDLTPLAALTQLKSLDVSSTQVSDLTPLAALTQLQQLDVTGMSVSDLTPISALTQLQQLDVGFTKISDLTPLAVLTHLRKFYAYETQVSDLTPLAGLTQLQTLNIEGTKVSDLRPLTALTQLQTLQINRTKVSDLTPLTALTQLQRLQAYNCKIRVLSRTLAERLEYIYLDGNPLGRPPMEIVKQGKAAMLAWFDANEGGRPLNEVKALLVGDGGAGKTSLVKQLFGEAFDPHESQTHGILIRDWKMNDSEITVHLWDFGGQEIMHATHQFFLSKRSLYILVLDGRKEEKTEYWLKHIATFGGASPVVIVINKIDENPGFDENRKDLLRKYPNIKGFYRISCKSGAGIGDFRRELRGHLAQVEHLSTRWGEAWFNVKTQLEQLEKPYIAYEHYAQMCETAQIADETSQTVLADFLHDLGIALHFHDPILKETNVINPRWATEGVYAIISAPQLAANNGLLPVAALCEILDCQRYPRRKHDYLVELMKKFELCYQVNDDTLLVPDLLSKDEPDFPFDEAAALRFRFEYDFLPRSVMPRFIVKMHRDILGDLRWRTGVVLRDPAFRATAVVRVDHEARAISIAVSGERKRDYFAVLRKTMRDLHATFETLDVKEMVPLPDHPDIAVEYDELLGCEQMKMTEYTVGKLRKRYNVTELLNGIEAAEERNSDDVRRRIDELQRKRRFMEQKRDATRTGIGVLDLPDDFRQELTDFLTTLPSISQQNGRSAFLINAGLDERLKQQILIEQAPAHFVPHLIDAACKFGASDGARHPLEMMLDAAKIGIGQDRRQQADEMIFHLRSLVHAAKSAARYAVEIELTGVENDLRRLETQLRLLDGRIL